MPATLRTLTPYIAAMALVIVASNVLVQYPVGHFGLDDILTWGAFTYPVAFFVNDLTNRHHGARAARLVVVVGFAIAVVLSAWLATPRIAIASGTAFLVAQMLDVSVFNRLRRQAWWKAPFVSTVTGSFIDTIIFFGLAFAPVFAGIDALFGTPDGSLGLPASLFGQPVALWQSLAAGDFCVKILIGLVMLAPYGVLLKHRRVEYGHRY